MLLPLALLALISGVLAAQEAPRTGLASRASEEPKPGEFLIPAGTRIPLALINSISTKHSAEGDRVYLETAFPILADGRIVIPPGSYVAGTVTHVKRPGRVKGRGELFVRFDSLTLPNGVTRDFRARVAGLDGRAAEDFDRTEGKIRSEGNKGGDARGVAEATSAGASVGTIAGAASGNWGRGIGIGAAAGATAGLVGVLLTRGPDAVLAKGTTLEMVTDRPLVFAEEEVPAMAQGTPGRLSDGPGPQPGVNGQNQSRGLGWPTRRF